MIEVHFFANLRETLGQEALRLPWRGELGSVRALIAALARQHGATWQQALQDERVLVAVNQEIATLDALLRDGDEVAFFPPVTGG
ncbi:MAG: molybdopterin converting factor subunit 1 [Pseudomonadales bacterium]|jgi:molybdopterin synthase sulfur carrier subunit|nr:molybdopterin converting factor subunit 1 [Pseudomonadales bacterium]